jgi:hypothetical protein
MKNGFESLITLIKSEKEVGRKVKKNKRHWDRKSCIRRGKG